MCGLQNIKLNILLNKIYQLFDRTFVFTCVVTFVLIFTLMLAFAQWSRSQTIVFDEAYPNGSSVATEVAFRYVGGKALVMVINVDEDPRDLTEQLSLRYSISISDNVIKYTQEQFKELEKNRATAAAYFGSTHLYNLCIIVTSYPDIVQKPFELFHEIGHCVQEFNSGSYAFEYFPTDDEYTDAFERVSGFSREVSERLLKRTGYIINREVFADLYAYHYLYTFDLMNHNEIMAEVKELRSIVDPVTALGYGTSTFLNYAGKHPIKKGERFSDFYTRVLDANLDKILTPDEFAVEQLRVGRAAWLEENAHKKRKG